jgi:hypothetical protein
MKCQVRVPRDSWPILLSQMRDSTNPEGQAPLFIFPRDRVAWLHPQALGSLFRRLLRLVGLRWKYLIPPTHGCGSTELCDLISLRNRNMSKCLSFLMTASQHTAYNLHIMSTNYRTLASKRIFSLLQFKFPPYFAINKWVKLQWYLGIRP